jgi:hypothetical protein
MGGGDIGVEMAEALARRQVGKSWSTRPPSP